MSPRQETSHKTRGCRGVTCPESYTTKSTTYTNLSYLGNLGFPAFWELELEGLGFLGVGGMGAHAVGVSGSHGVEDFTNSAIFSLLALLLNAFRGRTIMAHTRQSRPDSGPDFQVKDFETFKSVPSLLGSGTNSAGRAASLTQTSIYDKYSGSMKLTAQLDHISHCKTASGTKRPNKWTYRVSVMNTGLD